MTNQTPPPPDTTPLDAEPLLDKLLDIAEVASTCGITPATLRYYEKLDLICPAGRNGLRRTYRPDTIITVRVILLLKQAGFTLAEVSEFLDREQRLEGGWRDLVEDKLIELRETTLALTSAIGQLEHALTCTRADVLDCPFTIEALGAATSKTATAGTAIPMTMLDIDDQRRADPR